MKKFKLILLLVCLNYTSIISQNISESLISFEDTYYTLFGGSSGAISIDLVKGYTIGEVDTTYNVLISVANKEVVGESYSFGLSVFSSFSSVNTGYSKILTNVIDQSNLSTQEFMALYECSNNLFIYTEETKKSSTSPTNLVVSCNANNMIIGGEIYSNYNGRNFVSYYFKVGDETTYEMSRSQFISVVKVLTEIKFFLEEKNLIEGNNE